MDLQALRVAIVCTHGVEQIELTDPRHALDEAGADTVLISPDPRLVNAWRFDEWGGQYPVDLSIDMSDPSAFDALFLPGGVMSVDEMRLMPDVIAFVKAFFAAKKPVATLCHAAWLVLEAGEVRGRRIAAWPSLKTDLRNAGAEWLDAPVVVDGNLVSGRKPDDIPVFNHAMLRLFEEAARKLREGHPAPL